MAKYYPVEQRERAVKMVSITLIEYRSAYTACRAVDPNTPVLIEPTGSAASINRRRPGLAHHAGYGRRPEYHSRVSRLLRITGHLPRLLAVAGQPADDALAYGAAHNIPVMVDEFGATNDTTQLATEMQAGDQRQISWTMWG
jgi:endoglycosylceramidase